MLDAVSLTTIIMAALSIIGVSLQQIKHCKSGCCEIDKETSKLDSELLINKQTSSLTSSLNKEGKK